MGWGDRRQNDALTEAESGQKEAMPVATFRQQIGRNCGFTVVIPIEASSVSRFDEAMRGRDSSRLDYVDGLRGAACLAVIVCHLDYLIPWSAHLHVFGHDIFLSSSRWLAGYAGVNLFLVLSGFCLYLPIVRRGDTTLADFARRRARRILPPYFGLLAIWAILSIATRSASVFDIATPAGVYGTLLQTILPTHSQPWIAHTWSIALEAQCYLAFPLLVVAFRRFEPRFVLLVLAGICAAYRWAMVARFGHVDADALFLMVNNLPGRVFEFAIGMYVAHRRTAFNRERPWAEIIWLGLSIWILRDVIYPHSARRLAPWSDVAWGIVFAWFLAAVPSVGAMRRALEWRPLVWVGEISYSVYLLHAMVIIAAARVFAGMHGLALCAAELLLVVPAAIAIGYVYFLAVERRFLSKPSAIRTSQPVAMSEPAMPRA